ncbi:hypothetical protein MUCCIDRAFT_108349 [Mucor lusitanicus CBS 277.49]|uniref:Uncharacterized protein n=1 Tax=Mucor lusitanicus CBS 277.49 TaxID=747725 RepID=A0A168M824_MUCCL|nr:hypothetical protein MUCCIDRAFT_108349 [Mucor lusitanicus CBS 277.49]
MTANDKWTFIIGILKDLETGRVPFADDKATIAKLGQASCNLEIALSAKNVKSVIVPAISLAVWYQHAVANNDFKHDQMGIEAEFQKDISAIPSYRGSRHHQAYRVEPVLATTLEANIDAEMSKIGNALVNSIICFDNLRFLVTSIDGFAHIKGADNCSNQSTWISKEVFAVIHQKSEKGNTFYELSIIVHGCIEFLAVGGLIIMQNQPVNAFLGSSIKPLRNANVIDGEKRTTDVTTKSKRTALGSGFVPINPLDVSSHSLTDSTAVHCQSTILKMYAQRHIDQMLIKDLLRRLKQSPSFLRKKLGVEEDFFATFADLHKEITTNDKWNFIVGMLKDLETGRVSFTDNSATAVQNRASVLQLGNRGFSSALSKLNT